jgi:hypothetical protein
MPWRCSIRLELADACSKKLIVELAKPSGLFVEKKRKECISAAQCDARNRVQQGAWKYDCAAKRRLEFSRPVFRQHCWQHSAEFAFRVPSLSAGRLAAPRLNVSPAVRPETYVSIQEAHHGNHELRDERGHQRNVDSEPGHDTLPALTPPPHTAGLGDSCKVAEGWQQSGTIGPQPLYCAWESRSQRLLGARPSAPVARAWWFSDAQSQQFNDGETDYQHRDRHGIVIEPMLSEHGVHPPFVWTVGWVQQRNALRGKLFPTLGSGIFIVSVAVTA